MGWIAVGTFLGMWIGCGIGIYRDPSPRTPYTMRCVGFMCLGAVLGFGTGFFIAVLRNLVHG